MREVICDGFGICHGGQKVGKQLIEHDPTSL